jgi:hypothetical protein
MQVSTQQVAMSGDWENAAIGASTLSELELTLGIINPSTMGGVETRGAVGDAEQSVTYADRSRNEFLRTIKRTTHADALHQAGRRAEAETRFREAEQMRAQDQPDYPLLYSLSGFHYCDLLLAVPERAAGQMTLNLKTQNLGLEASIESCRAVSRRAKQTLKWMTGKLSLLDEALDRLTLGRAALYEVMLAAGGLPIETPNVELNTSIDAAVDGLRRAGQQYFLPGGLLSRAWLRLLTGLRTGPESAQEDLDEAWEIAERGPMRLHMADVHLFRARLFHDVRPYPWTSPQEDLAAARKLIEKCGYWRRKEELKDAEEAAKNW